MVILSAQGLLLVEKKPKLAAHPLPQVVGENEVPGEGVGEGRVEFQHFLQGIPFNHMQVTVGQGPNVGAGLGKGGFLPEHISKHISFPYREKAVVRKESGRRRWAVLRAVFPLRPAVLWAGFPLRPWVAVHSAFCSVDSEKGNKDFNLNYDNMQFKKLEKSTQYTSSCTQHLWDHSCHHRTS